MRTDEERTERRLIVESQTIRLATLTHPDLGERHDDPDTQRVRVEVSYADDWGEHAGFLIVFVPEIDPEGLSEDEALAAHPATLASDVVTAWFDEKADERGWYYTSIDDVFPA